jgi:hypothetical protein
MKKMSVFFALVTALLLISGCDSGYSSYAECRLKEGQKCSSQSCDDSAVMHCQEEYGWTWEKCMQAPRETDPRTLMKFCGAYMEGG